MKKSHCELLKEMLMKGKAVPISELRTWCNYRSRIDELRKKRYIIHSVKIWDERLCKTVWGYKMIGFPEDLFDKQTNV